MPPFGDGLPALSRSPEETRSLAAHVASDLRPGDVVALYGDLGTGKTEFVRGACAALGVDSDDVSSPSFTIVNEYAGRSVAVYHVDAYRIKRPDEFFELGYQEYFDGEGICFVEWPERIEALLPRAVFRLGFEHRGSGERMISVIAKLL
ncbi:MAG TPA: tRNA (adenosine(37)-N6)-threonylcarbamoyltransferase complex ATPase subunit type 1 TsaE [Rhodothermia bacterium]